MSTSYDRVKKFRQKRKQQIIYIMGEKCALCGYNKTASALELHHLDPSKKDFGISENINTYWDAINKEIQKCILVCSNCHREIHDNLILKEQLISSYNKERGEEITQEILKYKTKHHSYCQICGKEISLHCHYCQDCYKKSIINPNKPSREELKDLIRTVSFAELGRRFKISDNGVRKWCDTYNLPRKKTDIKKYSDEEWKKI